MVVKFVLMFYAINDQHMKNRQRLVDEGVVPCPPGMSSNNPENEAVKIAVKEIEVPKPVKKKKKKSKK